MKKTFVELKQLNFMLTQPSSKLDIIVARLESNKLRFMELSLSFNVSKINTGEKNVIPIFACKMHSV